MLEIIVILAFTAGIFLVDSLGWSLILIGLMLFLVAPGFSAMIGGAPFLRTSDRRLDAAKELIDFEPGMIVYDLGCGDGKVLRAFSRIKGVRAIGYELSIPLYIYAKVLSYFGGYEVKFKDFWCVDLSDADVVFCFLLESRMGDLKEKIWRKLKPGVLVVLNEFELPGLQPVSRAGKVLLYKK